MDTRKAHKRMRTTTRTYDTPQTAPGGNFSETTTGEIMATVEMSQNAKGKWQPSIKLHFTSIDDMRQNAPGIFEQFINELKRRFSLADD